MPYYLSLIEFQLLMSSPDDTGVDLSAYDDINYGICLMMDLNWFLSTFLGPLFSPEGFLKNPKICINGYVSGKYLEAAFEKFNLKKQELIQILDFYQVSLFHMELNVLRSVPIKKADFAFLC